MYCAVRFFVRLYNEELLTEALALSSQQLATQGWSFVSLAQNVTSHLKQAVICCAKLAPPALRATSPSRGRHALLGRIVQDAGLAQHGTNPLSYHVIFCAKPERCKQAYGKGVSR